MPLFITKSRPQHSDASFIRDSKTPIRAPADSRQGSCPGETCSDTLAYPQRPNDSTPSTRGIHSEKLLEEPKGWGSSSSTRRIFGRPNLLRKRRYYRRTYRHSSYRTTTTNHRTTTTRSTTTTRVPATVVPRSNVAPRTTNSSVTGSVIKIDTNRPEGLPDSWNQNTALTQKMTRRVKIKHGNRYYWRTESTGPSHADLFKEGLKASSADVQNEISGWSQTNKGNCATIGVLKACLDNYGTNIFRKISMDDDGLHVTLLDNSKVSVTTTELAQATKNCRFKGSDLKARGFATMAYAVMAKKALMLRNDGAKTYSQALHSIEDGENPFDAAKYLGVRSLMSSVSSRQFQSYDSGMAWNGRHAVFVNKKGQGYEYDYHGQSKNYYPGRSSYNRIAVFAPLKFEPAPSPSA